MPLTGIAPPMKEVEGPWHLRWWAQRPGLARTLLGTVVSLGTLGYITIEGWGPSDAFCMTVITLTTVGYRESHPLSRAGGGMEFNPPPDAVKAGNQLVVLGRSASLRELEQAATRGAARGIGVPASGAGL